MALLWILIAFISGALPLSVWLGKAGLGVDIRDFGDGNPGGSNVWRAGGMRWGLLAIWLDGMKGLLPVGFANFVVGVDGFALAAVAIAPILGHAFSPFLNFDGGKALAVTFGVWTGLTLWLGPMVLGILFGISMAIFAVEGWAVLVGSLGMLVAFLALGVEASWLIVWAGMTAVFLWKQRGELKKHPFQKL